MGDRKFQKILEAQTSKLDSEYTILLLTQLPRKNSMDKLSYDRAQACSIRL